MIRTLLRSELGEQFALSFVSRPFGHSISNIHYTFAVEDVCGRLEVEWDLPVRELE